MKDNLCLSGYWNEEARYPWRGTSCCESYPGSILVENRLSGLPLEIGQLKHLSHLVLYGNQLRGLSAEIGQLQNLSHLNLWENRQSNLPRTIGQLQHLANLDLSYNQLSSLLQESGNRTICQDSTSARIHWPSRLWWSAILINLKRLLMNTYKGDYYE